MQCLPLQHLNVENVLAKPLMNRYMYVYIYSIIVIGRVVKEYVVYRIYERIVVGQRVVVHDILVGY